VRGYWELGWKWIFDQNLGATIVFLNDKLENTIKFLKNALK
jgi:hypothetical protein